jgi:hypothetical protein
MNIALEQTEEYVNGQLKNKYGDAFIRGNNGKIIFFVIFPIINRVNILILIFSIIHKYSKEEDLE